MMKWEYPLVFFLFLSWQMGTILGMIIDYYSVEKYSTYITTWHHERIFETERGEEDSGSNIN